MCIVPLINRYVVGGKAALMCGRRTNMNSDTTEMKVVVASTRWSNWTVVGFSKKLRQRAKDDVFDARRDGSPRLTA